MARLRVLCLSPYFLPSRQGGGSVTALVSLAAHLKADVDLVVATGDRDLVAAAPYPPALQDGARAQAGIEIHYLPCGFAALRPLWRLLGQRWDLVYLNSILSPTFCALALALKRLHFNRAAVLVAPRGELMAGALHQRHRSKLAYLRLLRVWPLPRDARFHATSALEARELQSRGVRAIDIAGDLPPLTPALPPLQPAAPGPLRVVFLSRIEAKKNLLFALQALANVRVPVAFDIVGPVKDPGYWTDCQAAIAQLPAHIQTQHLGAVEPTQVLQTMARHELFLFPTLAENNGYVIHEALLAGCSLLISDQTPWRGLAMAGVGEDMPLIPEVFAAAITRFAELSAAERLVRRQRCRAYGLTCLDAREAVQATLRMFLAASSRRG